MVTDHDVMTVAEVAARLRVSRDHVYDLIAEGVIPTLPLPGRRKLVARAWVDQFISTAATPVPSRVGFALGASEAGAGIGVVEPQPVLNRGSGERASGLRQAASTHPSAYTQTSRPPHRLEAVVTGTPDNRR